MIEAATPVSANTARQPSVTFSISSSPPDNEEVSEEYEDEDDPNDQIDEQMASRYWLTVPNPLHQIRRLSDQGLRSARESIRRLSSSGSKFFRNANIARIMQVRKYLNFRALFTSLGRKMCCVIYCPSKRKAFRESPKVGNLDFPGLSYLTES